MPPPAGYNADMARPRRIECRICGGHVAQVGELSKRGRCVRCGETRVVECLTDLRAGTGEFHLAWLRGMARAVDRELARLQ